MATMTRRLQVLLDEDRYARLERHARARKNSVSTLVREALDATFPPEGLDRAEAVRRLLDAEPMPVDDWPLMKAELLESYERGLA